MVCIDRGYYKMGIRRNGESIQEPEWVSDNKAFGIAVGIEGQKFELFSINDRKDIIKHVIKLLESEVS